MNIVITGSEGLLGKALVDHFTNAGVKVIGIDILQKSGSDEIDYYSLNLASPDEIENEILDILANNDIDGWINTHYPTSEGWDSSPVPFASLAKVLVSHLASYVFITQLVCENATRPTSVVNLGSIYGSVSFNFEMYKETEVSQPIPYPAIKAGIIQSSSVMAVKYAGKGHRINCVSPGGIYNNHSEEFLINYSKRTPMKRMARVEELFSAFEYFLSPNSAYTTGQNLIIDGGYTLI